VLPQTAAGGKGAGRWFALYAGAFVTSEEGTGFVHVAPFYGADDYELSLRQGLAMVRAVGSDGRLEDSIGGVDKGTFFKDADHGLTADLKARGRLFDRSAVQHSYPFCWRCDTPLLYFASPAWFLTTTAYKDAMVAENRKTRWAPP
jgi:isoleucyl-tRNA synthetase